MVIRAFRALAPLFFLLIAASSSSWAVTGHTVVVLNDWCPDGVSQWTTIVEISRKTGRVVSIRGIDCDGNYWEKLPGHRSVSSPPYQTSDYLWQAEAGSGGTWWVRANMPAGQTPTALWGRDGEGALWTAAGLDGPDLD